MINVVTVHWQTPKWIEIQLAYLERNLRNDFRVFATLNGIADLELRNRFHYSDDVEGTHEEKLNALAQVVIEHADPTDTLIFIDGDAFPVRPLDAWISETLQSYPLAAVRRDENLGDPQPHPCFCVTTVGFWRDIGGDWSRGGTWTNTVGKEVTDPGGNLLHRLRELDLPWLPLLRTNTSDPHPLWFAIYGHLVYHHGAGFREMFSRADKALKPRFNNAYASLTTGPTIGELRQAVLADPSLLTHIRSRHALVFARALRKTLLARRRHWYLSRKTRYIESTVAQADLIFTELRDDPKFYLRLDGRAGEATSDSGIHRPQP
jgi:hypothetical protein